MMATQTEAPVGREIMDEYVAQAARAAGYEQGFGIQNCDLSQPVWWAAYCRQSPETHGHDVDDRPDHGSGVVSHIPETHEEKSDRPHGKQAIELTDASPSDQLYAADHGNGKDAQEQEQPHQTPLKRIPQQPQFCMLQPKRFGVTPPTE